MTLDYWLSRREPPPPPALAARLREEVGRLTVSSPDELNEQLLAGAERLLGRLLPGGCGTRQSALDLLVADALVTYAFEAASEFPASLEERATSAMSRLAVFGGHA
jgi:hypothetical protein